MYFGDGGSTYLALANASDRDLAVVVILHAQTGEPGAPSQDYALPNIPLRAKSSAIYNLRALQASLPGATWGSIEIRAIPGAVKAHTVTFLSALSDRAVVFDSEFLDPAQSQSATKAISPLVLDPSSDTTAYVMVRNVVTDAARVVTARLVTPGKVVAREVALGPGSQRLLAFNSRDVLDGLEPLAATLELSYDGTPADVVAAAASPEPAAYRATSGRLVEAPAADVTRLVSPYLRIDAGTDSALVITNFGDADALVGARMVYAEPGLQPLNTRAVLVPARSTVVEDITEYINETPGRLPGISGAVELLPIGGPARIAATVLTRGDGESRAHAIRFEPAAEPGMHSAVLVFPNRATLGPGDAVELTYVLRGRPAPVLTLAEGRGRVTEPIRVDAGVYRSVYTAPRRLEAHEKTFVVASPPGGAPWPRGTVQLNLYPVLIGP